MYLLYLDCRSSSCAISCETAAQFLSAKNNVSVWLFGMIRWEKPKNQTDTLFLAERNCAAVSHEIAHELLRQSGYKRYIEDVHEVWQKHLFGATPFEQYGENFKPSSKKPLFLALDTTMFGL